MQFLIDTNVFLESLLDQKKALEVKKLLKSLEAKQMVITDFSLHSIGVILLKLGKPELFDS